MEEFDLSEKIMYVFGNDKSKENMIEMISKEDVKEFIRRQLKLIEKLREPIKKDISSGEFAILKVLEESLINNAGEKLNGRI